MTTEEIKWELEKVGDQDTIFAHGYSVGYAFAKIQDKVDFKYLLLSSQLPTLEALLGGTDGQLTVGEPEKNGWGVEHIDVTVVFP